MKSQIELVHIMLKPETLKFGMCDIVTEELNNHGGILITSEVIKLSIEQIRLIYPNFPNEKVMNTVFAYFTSNATEHQAWIGHQGINAKYQLAKGRTGTNLGIRGKLFKNFRRLTQDEINLWRNRELIDNEDVDIEMFGRDILHVADSHNISSVALKSILSNDSIAKIKSIITDF